MPVKKRGEKARPHPITPEAVAAYQRGDDRALRMLLNLKPWHLSPLDVDAGDSPYPAGTAGAESYGLALELRDELEAAHARKA